MSWMRARMDHRGRHVRVPVTRVGHRDVPRPPGDQLDAGDEAGRQVHRPDLGAVPELQHGRDDVDDNSEVERRRPWPRAGSEMSPMKNGRERWPRAERRPEEHLLEVHAEDVPQPRWPGGAHPGAPGSQATRPVPPAMIRGRRGCRHASAAWGRRLRPADQPGRQVGRSPAAGTRRSGVEVGGSVAGGFAGVRDAFAEVLAGQPGAGASFAVWHAGNGWSTSGGVRRRRAAPGPGRGTPLVMPYSVTKPFAALCVLTLVDRGLVELDAPMQRYWPSSGRGDGPRRPVPPRGGRRLDDDAPRRRSTTGT